MGYTDFSAETVTAAMGGDPTAVCEIVTALEGTIWSVVRREAPTAGYHQIEDLVQEGRACIVERLRSYDAERPDPELLVTVLQYHLRKVVSEEAARASSVLSVEPSAVKRVRAALAESQGDVRGAWVIVSDADRKHAMSRETFVSVLEAMAEAGTLDVPLGGGHDDGDALCLVDVIADVAPDFADRQSNQQLVAWILRQLSLRENLALRAYYGIGMQKTEDVDQAAQMGISSANLRQLRTRGIKHARMAVARAA